MVSRVNSGLIRNVTILVKVQYWGCGDAVTWGRHCVQHGSKLAAVVALLFSRLYCCWWHHSHTRLHVHKKKNSRACKLHQKREPAHSNTLNTLTEKFPSEELHSTNQSAAWWSTTATSPCKRENLLEQHMDHTGVCTLLSSIHPSLFFF